METEALGESKADRKLVFHRVAENLYRLETSGGYYALLKRGDKQFRRSLKTGDRKLAERRLAELPSGRPAGALWESRAAAGEIRGQSAVAG